MTDSSPISRSLSRRFFARDAATVATALLGKTLVRTLCDGTKLAGTIVETEAYLGPTDRAAHSFNNHRSLRNESMYAQAGTAYVYFTYGMHHCVNVVTGRVDEPAACLIRAIEPTRGIDRMRAYRAVKISADRLRDTDVASGPAKLTQALAIDRDLDGIDLTTDAPLTIERGRRIAQSRIVAAPRIGVDYAGSWANRRLRFYIDGNPHVSVVDPKARRMSR